LKQDGTRATPYQAEIAQGRFEAILNFQTMVIEPGNGIANASFSMRVLLLQSCILLFDVRTRDQKKKAMYANFCF
jgi:glycine cleavage system pyridoxal-binding protein P